MAPKVTKLAIVPLAPGGHNSHAHTQYIYTDTYRHESPPDTHSPSSQPRSQEAHAHTQYIYIHTYDPKSPLSPPSALVPDGHMPHTQHIDTQTYGPESPSRPQGAYAHT